jgi:hypothetical protein
MIRLACPALILPDRQSILVPHELTPLVASRHPFVYRSSFRSRAKGNAGGKGGGHHSGSGGTPAATTTWNPSDKSSEVTLDNSGERARNTRH